jgi:hypothetical protein
VPDGSCNGEQVKGRAPGARVVKALNTAFAPLDAGPLAMARAPEAMAVVNIMLQMWSGWPWQTGWRLVGPTGSPAEGGARAEGAHSTSTRTPPGRGSRRVARTPRTSSALLVLWRQRGPEPPAHGGGLQQAQLAEDRERDHQADQNDHEHAHLLTSLSLAAGTVRALQTLRAPS